MFTVSYIARLLLFLMGFFNVVDTPVDAKHLRVQ